jgi:NAD-dependent deacetylase
VQHLHGSLHHPRCFDCGCPFSLPDAIPQEPECGRRLLPPKCQDCGGLIRPGVVWFNELLPNKILNEAFELSSSCDLLIVVGTSGKVYPVARLAEVAARAGCKLIQINPAESELDGVCTWNLRASAAKLLPSLIRRAF